jgi:hypothetical protein
VTLTPTLRDADNNVQSLVGRTITWTSSNTAIATVINGVVTGVAAGGPVTITATCEAGVGTALVTVLPGVNTVTVTLAASTIQPGDNVQATAVTLDGLGTVLTGRPVTWSTSNSSIATVSTAGLVTGRKAGTVNIIASSEGHPGSATLTLIVEPTGLTPGAENDFTTLVGDGWTIASANVNDVTIENDPTAPKSPSSVAAIHYPAGYTGGGSPAVVENDINGTPKTLYVSYWVKLSSNWQGHESSVNKQMHLWIGDTLINRVYTLARGVGNGALSAEIALQGVVGSEEANLTPNLGVPATVVRGQWHHWEIVLTANSAGTPDGVIEWWLDGVKVGRYTNIQFTTEASRWKVIQWSPTWGGVDDVLAADQTMWMDHIFVSGKP